MMNKCKNCGGVVRFNPKEKGNMCESCKSVFPVIYNPKFNKKNFEENVTLKEDELAKSLTQMKCGLCGASVLLNKNQLQAKCAYCGGEDLVKERKKALMYIDSIVPFTQNKTDAIKGLKKHLAKRFFANKKLFKNTSEENVSGAYINAFAFDMSTYTTYSGVFSYTRSYKDSDGKTRTETIKKNVNGNYSKFFKNIVIEANSNFEQKELESIEPYNFGAAVEFKEDFINGYMLEHQDKMFNECFKTADSIIKEEIKEQLLRQHGCEKIESINMSVSYLDRKYNYCLLPVYFVTSFDVKKNKTHRVVMNGQTGKVGKVPLHGGKIFLFALGICAALSAVLVAILHFCK